ncbi:MAG: mandelate racemase/muconate lactonizing enzyme family protein [Alphaproteobacteria bacterium]|nr:mandelate racemase/muconate lactonizing enzyme family protein [Alphaproteobacteria bacterium]
MKIERVETFIFQPGSGKELLFCRVETEDGLHGWGEAYVTPGKARMVAECIAAMSPYVIGRSVFNIRHTGQVMFDDFATRRGSMESLAAWSAVEIASWDIIGKHTGLPVYNLIGGASRERVRVYANGWSRGASIEEGVERGRKVKAMGFTAAKFDPFPGPWRTHVDRKDEDFAIDYVSAMREALGPDFELLIEAHRRFAPSHAIRIGHRLAELGIDWYEEPCLADNLDLLVEVRRAVPIPIVTGEALYSKEAFFACIARRAADILNPDICAMGGISALMDIAAMAQPQAIVMSPHNYNSTLVGLAATVHVSAVIPNFRITEYFVNFADACAEVATASLQMQEGWIDLPTAPGLGIDLDVAKLRVRPHQEISKHGFRQYWEEYPRKGYTPSLG